MPDDAFFLVGGQKMRKMSTPQGGIGAVPVFSHTAPIQHILDSATDAGRRFRFCLPDWFKNLEHIFRCDRGNVLVANDRGNVAAGRVSPLFAVLCVTP